MIALDDIERIAKAATQGEWRWDNSDCHLYALQDEGTHAVTVAFALVPDHEEPPRLDIDERDRLHIATMNPAATLELVARVRELESALREACDIADRADWWSMPQTCNEAESIDVRIAELRKLVT